MEKREADPIGGCGAIPRREFLMGSAAAAGAAAAGAPGGGPGRMKIGVNLEFVRHADKSLAYGVKRAAEIGFPYVEPCFLMGRCLLSEAGYCHVTSLDVDPSSIVRMMREAGVRISALSSHSDLLDPEFGVMYARKGIRFAKAVGTNIVQITENMAPAPWVREDAYAIMRTNLRAIAETCAENGVYLGVEQHGPFTAKIPSLLEILSLVDSPWIKVNYDCGNTYLAGTDPYEMLDAVIDRVVHVHAKDISIRQSEAERGKVTGTAVGCACGDGVIDWHRIVRRLAEAGFQGVLSVECGTEEEAARSLAHLRKVLDDVYA